MSKARPWSVYATLLTPAQVERFWGFVDRRANDECWPWTGRLVEGYGTFGLRHRDHLVASRVIYFLTTACPVDAPVIRHTCDNPPCVNPAHLLPGTHLDNAQDMIARGRHRGGKRRGVRMPQSRPSLRRLQAQRGCEEYDIDQPQPSLSSGGWVVTCNGRYFRKAIQLKHGGNS